MHCSRCGNAITDDLNFCSKCGERVNKNELAESSKKQSEMLDNLAIALICVGGGGMLFLVGLVAVLLDKTIPTQLMVLIIAMYIAAWLVICLKLLGQISKLVDANLAERKAGLAEPSAANFLPPRSTAQLDEYREPASVTEPTTRTLDEVMIERGR